MTIGNRACCGKRHLPSAICHLPSVHASGVKVPRRLERGGMKRIERCKKASYTYPRCDGPACTQECDVKESAQSSELRAPAARDVGRQAGRQVSRQAGRREGIVIEYFCSSSDAYSIYCYFFHSSFLFSPFPVSCSPCRPGAGTSSPARISPAQLSLHHSQL